MVLRIARAHNADGEDPRRTNNTQHVLYFTPPYHPELQPIERVWCAVKNEIARNPVTSLNEMDARLWTNFETLVTEKVLLSTYRKSKEWEETYRTGDDDVVDEDATDEAEPEEDMSEDEDELEDESEEEQDDAD